MSLNKIFDVTGSGMSSQSVRLNTVASNIANADSVSTSANTVYKARKPVFAASMANMRAQNFGSTQEGVGVQVLGIVESDAPVQAKYLPDHPLADKDGMVYESNVNIMEEMADMISASRAYQMNIDVADNAKTLLLRTLSLGQ